MNIGQLLGYLLILSGIILTIGLITSKDITSDLDFSKFFSVYAGVCFAAGSITVFINKEKYISNSKDMLKEVRIFGDK